jgi:hypothetical protein
MLRMCLAATAALLMPAMASATYIVTNVDTAFTVQVKKGANAAITVHSGAWDSKFHSGSLPNPNPNNPSTLIGRVFTYCVSTDKTNTPSDSYNLPLTDLVSNAYASKPQLVEALRFLLENTAGVFDPTAANSMTVTARILRAATQAAIWKMLFVAGESLYDVVGNFNTTGLTGVDATNDASFASKYAELLGTAMFWYQPENNYTGLNSNPNFFSMAGQPGGPNDNQNMIYYNPNGPIGGFSPVPLPGTVYGSLALLAMCLAGRRLFGLAA